MTNLEDRNPNANLDAINNKIWEDYQTRKLQKALLELLEFFPDLFKNVVSKLSSTKTEKTDITKINTN